MTHIQPPQLSHPAHRACITLAAARPLLGALRDCFEMALFLPQAEASSSPVGVSSVGQVLAFLLAGWQGGWRREAHRRHGYVECRRVQTFLGCIRPWLYSALALLIASEVHRAVRQCASTYYVLHVLRKAGSLLTHHCSLITAHSSPPLLTLSWSGRGIRCSGQATGHPLTAVSHR